jgi:DNA repair protein RecO (recombination protein O)
VLAFELAALREAGHAPSLDQCVVCGRPVEANARVAFGMTSGGVLCDECRPGRRGVVSVSGGVIAALKFKNDDDAANNAPLDPAIGGELRAVMSNYFAHLVGHRLRMSTYLAGQPAK